MSQLVTKTAVAEAINVAAKADGYVVISTWSPGREPLELPPPDRQQAFALALMIRQAATNLPTAALPPPRDGRRLTIKDYALAALRDGPADTDTIRVLASAAAGRAIERASLSPQLTRLNRAGKIVREDRQWRLRREPDA